MTVTLAGVTDPAKKIRKKTTRLNIAIQRQKLSFIQEAQLP